MGEGVPREDLATGEGAETWGWGGGGLPPEEELESTYGAPVATGKFVWVANPTSGRVAYINAATLEINVVEAGNAPTVVAAVPDPADDVAIVLNVLSNDATLFRAKTSEVSALQFDVPSGGNAWAISADGHFAIAWTNSKLIKEADPIDGFQNLTVIDLTASENPSHVLTVGYRPVTIGFDAESKKAFAVSQDGITVIGLDQPAPSVIKNIKLGGGPSTEAVGQDVAITPDGAYALVRSEGSPNIGVFSLETAEKAEVTLSAPVTDLDLSPDGKVGVAVVRDTGETVLLPIPEIFTDPAGFATIPIAGVTVGSASLAKTSPLAFLYTNAVPSPILTSIDTSDAAKAPVFYQLWAPIQSVFPTNDASHAVVIHSTADVPNSTYPAAMSVLPVAADLPAKLQGLDGPVVSVAISPQGHRAIVATGDEQLPQYRLYVAAMPSLEVTQINLASEPIAAGIVAQADRGYVAQKHPDGRITFVDFKSGEVRTLTGFELGSQVVDGSGE
ncbi:MAG: hypothetical protein IPK82_32030 [Polyangiaceae bacterium]|nr:hypothetical protein [Polyangiaceae bacterium]